uniref:Protein Wnt n=1 Tax=Ciona savignyi TaxID=51511 RepID=H2YRP8_CIOSA
RTLSSVASLRPGLLCNKIDGLAPSQRRMCQARPDLMPLIAKGVHRAWYECQWQFRNNKWNCTHNGTNSAPNHWKKFEESTKESAFEYAIKSAGILYEIVKACGEGRLGTQVSPSQVDRGMYQRWRWGGCSVDLGFGLNYTREFVDGREIQRTTRSLMNRHNLEAGRLAITKNLTKSCRCHGVSGSCNVRTCWIALPSFRQVGNNLRQKFVSARRVDAILGGKRRRPHILKIRNKARKPSPRELVFLDTSPEFCERDRRTGIFGTSGRQCNGSAQNYSGCDSLCCNRGYRTAEYDKQEPCRCKFFWCCTVTCQKCIRKVKTYTCN